MKIQALSPLRKASLVAACAAAVVGILVYAAESPIFAEDGASSSDGPAKSQNAGKRKHRASQKTKGTPAKDGAPDQPTQAGGKPGAIDFAASLEKAGASACRNQVNELATATMGSVEKYNTVANWSQVGGEKRAVSLAIGQKYANGSAVPFGVSQVISTPNPQGSCDGFTTQVFPSPLSCSKLRDSMKAQRGQQIGDLAGIALMQDAAGRTMLVPTAADTCVLIATKTFYAK